MTPLTQEWVQKAEADFAAMEWLRQAPDSLPDALGFHAQQCVEKYLKALLCFCEVDFYRTHDLGALMALLPAHLRPELSAEEQARLGDYAVATRYPGDYEPVSLDEAKRAVQMARRVRNQVRRRLPQAIC